MNILKIAYKTLLAFFASVGVCVTVLFSFLYMDKSEVRKDAVKLVEDSDIDYLNDLINSYFDIVVAIGAISLGLSFLFLCSEIIIKINKEK